MEETYNMTNGLKEWRLNSRIFKKVFLEKTKIFNINPMKIKFYSQQDEDKYIIQKILNKPIKGGTFLEAGACDGIMYSNTKTLEDYFGFTGILIEPVKEMYNKLILNRPKCKNFNCSISNIESKQVEMIGHNACSGISHLINKSSKHYLSKQEVDNPYKTNNMKLTDVIKQSGFKYIDIMSIDVEGAELTFLESFDFKTPVFCIIIEADSDEKQKNKVFGDFLKSKGFTYIERQRGNEVWINKDYPRIEYFNIPNNL